MSKPVMIPMARVRAVVEAFGDFEAVPWSIFLVLTEEERPLTDDDYQFARRAQLLLHDPPAFYDPAPPGTEK